MPLATPTGIVGQLRVETTDLICPAWRVRDLTPLWASVTVRGSDVLMPTVNGVVGRRRRLDAHVVDLEMIVVGDVDQFGVSTGTTFDDHMAGLADNLTELFDLIVNPVVIGDGTRPAILTMPDGSTRIADVHTVGFEAETLAWTTAARAVLSLSIPAGRFS